MSVNLLSQVTNLLDENTVSSLANLVGGSSGATQKTIGAALPKLLNGFSESVSTRSGAENMLGLITEGNHDGSILDHIPSLLSGGSATENFLSGGQSLLSSIFGNKLSSLLDGLGAVGNMGKSANSTILGALAPILMGAIGKIVKSENLSATGLQNLLSAQSGNMPDIDLSTQTPNIKSGGSGILKWLLPLLVLLALGYFLMRSCGDGTTSTDAVTDDTQVENTEMNTGDMLVSVDQAGNLIDQTGKVLAEVGTFSVNAEGIIKDINGSILFPGIKFSGEIPKIDLSTGAIEQEIGYFIDDAGNLVDKAGKVVVKAGEFEEKDGYYVDKQGNRLGKILGKFIAAVKEAASDVGAAFKDLFSSADKKGSLFTLQKMTFNPESHLITTYSQEEVKALAEALKAQPDAKIEIHNYTADSGDKKADNKNQSSLRAQVLEQMLTALGVNPKQISTKGMGNSDATKAANNTMEILVK